MEIRFGFHTSGGKKLDNIPKTVEEIGGECFQFFSRNPYGGKISPITKEQADKFKEDCKKVKLTNYFIHTPYFINLASKNNRIFYGSIKAIQEDIERAELLGAKYVVTHIGSGKDFKEESGNSQISNKFLLNMAKERGFSPLAFERIIEGLEKISDGRKNIPLILEIAAGAGSIMGVKLKEIAFYLKSVPALSGFCFDTAHAFASGYDLRTKENIENIMEKIEKLVGKDKVKLIHLNDSKAAFNSNKDRHAHLGEGELDKDPFFHLVDYFHKKKYNIDMILETPTLKGLVGDLELLKGYRSQILNSSKT